jgi:hypothetical protein
LLKAWNKTASNTAVDLLARMLAPEASRASISQVLQHPFFAASRARRSE